jgi:hypothetical protein
MKNCFVFCLAVASMPCLAADQLPSSMKGRWYGIARGGSSLNFDISVSELKQGADGSVEGKLTRFGNGCGADGEPLKGTFDGTTLAFESTSKPGVNTRRMGGDCGVDKYSLKAASGSKSYVGTLEDKQGNSFTIELSP